MLTLSGQYRFMRCWGQGPTSTLYSNRTRIFLSYSNPTRKFLKNDRVASSVYYSHFRKIAARPASQYYSLMDTALVEILSFILSLSLATNLAFYIIFNFSNKQTRNLFSTSNVMMKLLTIIKTVVMIRIITAVMIITKYSLPTVDFATRYSTRYSDFLLQPYSNPTRSQKRLLVGAWSPDALEVIVFTHRLIVSTDLTDVTLASDDTY